MRTNEFFYEYGERVVRLGKVIERKQQEEETKIFNLETIEMHKFLLCSCILKKEKVYFFGNGQNYEMQFEKMLEVVKKEAEEIADAKSRFLLKKIDENDLGYIEEYVSDCLKNQIFLDKLMNFCEQNGVLY